MSWYPLDGTILFVRSIADQGPLDMTYDTDSSWQWGIDRHFFSIPSLFQESRISIGFSQGLDWREVMSWYTVCGAAYTVIDTTLQETWSSPLRASVIARGSGTWAMIGHGGIGIREDCLLAGTVRDQFGIPTLRVYSE